MTSALGILLIALIINAVYVAAEFATVSLRKSRVETLAEDGNAAARLLLPNIKNAMTLYRYVAACQIGITASSLFMGAYAQSALIDYLQDPLLRLGLSPATAPAVATAVILLVLTSLQVVLGELVPKSVAMRYPERVALTLTYVLHVSMRVFAIPIRLLHFLGRSILGWFGVPMHVERHVHSPEEIELLIIRGREKGALAEEEHRRLRRVLRFGERKVREVMVPRTRMRTLSRAASSAELLDVMAASPYTRLPVFGGSLDEIVGILHIKDVAIALTRDEPPTLEALLRPVLHVPLAQPIDQVLESMRKGHAQMAIVLDEYGGTAGLVTMEDLVEEILGDVQDEFDREVPAWLRLADGRAVARGDLSLSDLEDELGIDLGEEEVHTVGGLVMKLLGRPPRVGDAVEQNHVQFTVEEMRGKRLQRVGVVYAPPTAPPTEMSGEEPA